jgi:hypothetical protein
MVRPDPLGPLAPVVGHVRDSRVLPLIKPRSRFPRTTEVVRHIPMHAIESWRPAVPVAGFMRNYAI